MDPAFWHDRWQKGDIGFHRPAAHHALAAYWARTGARPGATVLVPLCGKSLDMRWLTDQGHRVLGVELSEIAVDAFFESQRLVPQVRETAGFKVKSAGAYELWCGDLFAMPASALTAVAAVYDRASLVALPPDRQVSYVRWLVENVPPTAPALIIALAYDETEMKGPPFSIPDGRVHALLDSAFDVERLQRKDAIDEGMRKRGLSSLEETIYMARRKSP